MISQFEDLLEQLGKVLHLSLHLDRKSACSIRLHTDLVLQLQLDSTEENLWLFCKIAETPPGKFRENILKDALKANGMADPRPGVLGFILSLNQLALSQKYPLSILNGERLSGLIAAFTEMAEEWKEAIQKGESSPLKMRQDTNPFGLR